MNFMKQFKGKKGAVPFEGFTGDVNWIDEDGVWISRRLYSEEIGACYWLFIEFENMDRWGDWPPSNGKYLVTVSAVSPAYAPKKRFEKAKEEALRDLGEPCTKQDIQNVMLYNDFANGKKAPLVELCGNNSKELLRTAKRAASDIFHYVFDVKMEQSMNAICNNGYDFMSGRVGFGEPEVSHEDVVKQERWFLSEEK